MGSVESLLAIEITVLNTKKYFLITKYQLATEAGEIFVNYVSGLNMYKSKRLFIEQLHDHLADNISVDGVVLPDDNLPYLEKEKYLTQYINTIIVQSYIEKDSIDIDTNCTVAAYTIENKTSYTSKW